MAIEDLKFIKKFQEICLAGYNQNWHERNGGNLTYRLTDAEVESAKTSFSPREWVKMDVENATLAGEFFMSTASGAHMRNMVTDLKHSAGIVEINEHGNAYRIVWGLEDGVKPTSEFPSHYLNHCVRAKETDGQSRVIYHAHPGNVVALSAYLPCDAKEFTYALWQVMTECVVIFPEGVGVLPWMMPGGADIAIATSELMHDFKSVVWYQHGIFCAGNTLDDAFGEMHTIEKAADIYIKQVMLCGGKKFTNTISSKHLQEIADEFGVKIRKEFL